MVHRKVGMIVEKRDEWDSSGQIAYEKACKKYGVIVSSTFHNKLRYANSIDLGYYGVGVDGAKAIAVAFCVSCEYTSVNLVLLLLQLRFFGTQPSLLPHVVKETIDTD